MKKIHKTNSLPLTKIALVSFFIAGAISGGANAVVKKCVPLVDGNQTTCTSNPAQYDYHADWGATCTTNGVTAEIKGIAACSDQRANNSNGNWANPSTRQETITNSVAPEDNFYCWCKMTSPAVSPWVFSYDLGNSGYCTNYCAYYCATIVSQTADFRSALFSNMTD